MADRAKQHQNGLKRTFYNYIFRLSLASKYLSRGAASGMATVLAIVVAAYLLVGVALGIRWHGFRGGVWIIVIALTAFIWPQTLLALRLDEERRLFWPVAANEVAVSPSGGSAAAHGTTKSQMTNESKKRRYDFAPNPRERAQAAQEFMRAMTELLKAERQEGGPTIQQRLAVDHARARARAILPRRILVQATEEAFSLAQVH
jgi:hypothetical protein